nr:MAG TPA: hypothetical protein [Caudoviricetes sp.]
MLLSSFSSFHTIIARFFPYNSTFLLIFAQLSHDYHTILYYLIIHKSITKSTT